MKSAAPLPALTQSRLLFQVHRVIENSTPTSNEDSSKNDDGSDGKKREKDLSSRKGKLRASLLFNGKIISQQDYSDANLSLKVTNDPIYIGLSPWQSLEGGGGGGGGKGQSGPITWHPEYQYKNTGNISFSSDMSIAIYNSSSTHRYTIYEDIPHIIALNDAIDIYDCDAL